MQAARQAAAAPPAATIECFHCGLAVEPGAQFAFEARGEWRRFCCAGCEAVSRVIHGERLEDYYRLRVAVPDRPEGREGLGDLALFDTAAVQERFVRDAGGGLAEADLVLEGIRCAACAWLIERMVGRTPGVVAVEVNATTRRARVRWNRAALAPSGLFATIRRVGYDAWPYEEGRVAALDARERRSLLRRLWVAGLAMMQVMMYAVPTYLAGEGDITADARDLMRWAGLVLTVPVIAYSAAPFFRGAWRDARLARLGMDVPVALGIAVAFAASAWATIRGAGEVYFDSVTMFVFLLTAGRFLEHGARVRAARSLQHLSGFIPQSASRRLDAKSLETQTVSAGSLVPGDRVLVRPGEALPADGVLEDAQAAVSEALLNGESRIARKRRGDRVIGGSINSGSAFTLRVTHVGADTVLAGIRDLMDRAAAQRPRWVEMADRASAAFVAFILAAALGAGLAWLAIAPERALWIAVAVLIVTCPCALSLATPVAMTIATGALSRRNVAVTRAHAIEGLARATDIVFDKTGTLTQGKPWLREVLVLRDIEEADCLRVAAAIGRGSAHPLDRALVEAAGEGALEATDHRTVPGEGAEALVEGRLVRIGSARFAGALHGKAAPLAWMQTEDSVAWLADASGWIAAFRLGDDLRPEARDAVDQLRSAGLVIHLLTGDEPQVAGRIAGKLGIEHVEWRVTPQRKKEYVEALQWRGARVVMVGDGINDAPVLAQADVSIAMASGADLAQLRADAVLMSDRLDDLVDAFRIARKARVILRENLVWALGYNLVAIPLAAAGMVTPLLAGIGMSVSSLAVVANAMRLAR
ncbi:MAG: heavy metal translocating P-type ATPase [Usitatibacter sp.]